jgi:geranylgeranyl pyrophosphate synthase
MSEGELLQIEKARRMDIDEAIYFDIIRGKTAFLPKVMPSRVTHAIGNKPSMKPPS